MPDKYCEFNPNQKSHWEEGGSGEDFSLSDRPMVISVGRFLG